MTSDTSSQGQAGHTPLPWEVSDVHPTRVQYAGTGDEICDTKYATELTRAAHGANAVLIVTAVNSHASLKQRVKELTSLLTFLRENDGECIGDHPDWIARIDAALSPRGET